MLFGAMPISSTPAGLTYVKDVLSAAQERDLVNDIGGLNLKPFEFRGFTGKRRTVSFGWRYDFNGGGFQRADAMPNHFMRVRDVMAERLELTAQDFEQCSVIEYAPGAGIGWHRDRPQFGKVAGLSLLAPCHFRFRRQDKASGWLRQTLLLEPRSAYVLDGEVRRDWQHSIPALACLRYSITFRTLAH